MSNNAASQSSKDSPKTTTDDDPEKSIISELPKALFWDSLEIYQWRGFWFEPGLIEQAMRFRSDFKPRDDDVLLASSMKTGTTWLKSLVICITAKSKQDNNVVTTCLEDILTKETPHLLLPTIEIKCFFGEASKHNWDYIYDENPTDPRLMHTHLPYTVLPESLKNSRCKVVYIARNPKDTVVSLWHFFNTIIINKDQEPYPLSKLVDSFCSGEIQCGPYFDHVLEYWLQSKKNPEKILFVRYEEMKSDPKGRVRKIAEFLGEGFKSEAEIDETLWRCSLDRLKSLEVNNRFSVGGNVPNSAFFRKGVVGDSKNYLTREMEEKIDRMSRDKFEPHGLFF